MFFLVYTTIYTLINQNILITIIVLHLLIILIRAFIRLNRVFLRHYIWRGLMTIIIIVLVTIIMIIMIIILLL